MKHRDLNLAAANRIKGLAHVTQLLIIVVGAMAMSYGVYTTQVVNTVLLA